MEHDEAPEELSVWRFDRPLLGPEPTAADGLLSAEEESEEDWEDGGEADRERTLVVGPLPPVAGLGDVSKWLDGQSGPGFDFGRRGGSGLELVYRRSDFEVHEDLGRSSFAPVSLHGASVASGAALKPYWIGPSFCLGCPAAAFLAGGRAVCG